MPHAYRFAEVEVLPVERQVLVGGRPAPVGSRAFDVLLALVERGNDLATKDQLFDAAWPGLVVGDNTLQAQVSALRKLLGDAVIKTVARRGYRLAVPVETFSSPGANGSAAAALAARALFSESEQAEAIARLAVFVGAFRFEAAQHVLNAAEHRAVQRLVAIGLLDPVPGPVPRVRLRDAVRAAARERLIEGGGMQEAVRLHCEAMAGVAREAIQQHWHTASALAWVRAHRPDYEDLEAAFQRACDRRDASAAAPIVRVLMRLDIERDPGSARRRKEAAACLLRYADTQAKAHLLTAIGSFRSITIPQISQLDAAIQREALWRRLDNPLEHYGALMRLANAHANAGSFAAAAEAIRAARKLEDPQWPARVRANGWLNVANVCQSRRDAAGVREAAHAMMALGAEAGDEAGEALGAWFLASAACMAGDHAGSVPLLHDAARRLRSSGLWRQLGEAYAHLCGVCLATGDIAGACEAASQALPLVIATDSARLLDHLALLSARLGRHLEAALLLGYGEASREWKLRKDGELVAQSAWTAAHAAQASLGAREHARLRRVGAEMTQDRAIALACDTIAAARREAAGA